MDGFVALFILSGTKNWICIFQEWICQWFTHSGTKMAIYPIFLSIFSGDKQVVNIYPPLDSMTRGGHGRFIFVGVYKKWSFLF